MTSFDSTKLLLFNLLKDINTGKIQLPDFQRNWVWDDNRIKGIIASVAKSFPIGAVMLLETGNPTVNFKTKPIEGVKSDNLQQPDLLVLDGQQRLTALYQTIVTNNIVKTRNEKGYELHRWYYIDMIKAMDDSFDLEEAIISVNEKKQITTNIGRDIVLDLSQEQYEYEKLMYPVCMVDEFLNWQMNFMKYWNYNEEKIKFVNEFHKQVIDGFSNYALPVIVMKKENSKEAVCQIFEKVNTGGVTLTVFELLTATFASDEFDLKEDWEKIKTKFKEHKILSNTSNTDIIQAITLYSTYQKRIKDIKNGSVDSPPAVSAKRKEMLDLTLSDYLNNRDDIVEGFIKAAKLLSQNHIFNARDLPYTSQLIPMSAILAQLNDKIENIGNKHKLMRWFWCGVLGELYGSANETRYANDLVQVVDWIENNQEEPKTIYDANFSPSRLHTLRTRNSAAYKGIYALLMDDNIKDWLTGTSMSFSTYYSESIDIHHIFPVAWCEKNNINRNDYDCIINKTPLSGRTNRIVSGDAPSKYLVRLMKHVGVEEDEFLSILRTHTLNPAHLYSDDFPAFFNERKEQILNRIEIAMGKQIPRETSETTDNELFLDIAEVENSLY